MRCLLWLYWLGTRVLAYRHGQLALGDTLYLISHLLIYPVGYVLITEPCSGWLLANVWHNVRTWHFLSLRRRWDHLETTQQPQLDRTLPQRGGVK